MPQLINKTFEKTEENSVPHLIKLLKREKKKINDSMLFHLIRPETWRMMDLCTENFTIYFENCENVIHFAIKALSVLQFCLKLPCN